jgi:hypothetical protein
MARDLAETLESILTQDYGDRIRSVRGKDKGPSVAAHRGFQLARGEIFAWLNYDLWIRMAKQGFRFAAIPEDLANSRMHTGAKTIYEREAVFQASMSLLERHYGYIPLPWVFGYTTWRRDGRDQFFEPLRPTARNYLASLPMGLRLNPRNRARFLREWLAAPLCKLLG